MSRPYDHHRFLPARFPQRSGFRRGRCKTMPKWIVYCRQCNRPSPYREINSSQTEDDAIVREASPSVKKPALPANGDRRECPFCKRESRIEHCDLTYSYI